MRSGWRGGMVMVVGALHTAFTFTVASGAGWSAEMLAQAGGSPPLGRIVPGFGSGQPPDLAALAFFWSIACGLAIVLFGAAVRAIESGDRPPPRGIGVALIVLAVTGGVLVPVSGFWLLLVPGWSLARAAAARR